MLLISLLLNIAVLIPVVSVLIIGTVRGTHTAAQAPWGERTPARDILLAIYIAILVVSIALLAGVALGGPTATIEAAAAALFTVQIVYKVLTAVTVRDALRNPVVLSNLGIAVVHAITVATLAPALFA
jgi:hypothetical protein